MTTDRRRATVTLLLGLLVLAPAGAQAGEGSRVERTESLLVVRVREPFEEVLRLLEAAIARRNYFVAGTNHLDDTLRRRAAELGGGFPFDHYKIVSFCSLSLAQEALETHPYMGAFMPCRLAVFVARGSAEVTIVSVRPTFLSRALGAPEVARLATRVEEDVLEILEMVAGD
jgi:uncharacterized protein (DUF302 family)